MASIRFFTEGALKFKLKNSRKTSLWLRNALTLEEYRLVGLSYIFCSDQYLLGLNTAYLQHETLTDVITFDFAEGEDEVSGEVYISIERIAENALKFKTSFHDELHRVIIHGLLHLMGYSDKNKREKEVMREKEEAYLSLRK